MEDAATITDAVKRAWAGVNFLVWTGLFLYLLYLDRKLRRLEASGRRETEGAP
jgi:CcmD family protein